MDDEYDFSNDFSEGFNKAGDNAPPPPPPKEEKELNKNLPPSSSGNLRSMLKEDFMGSKPSKGMPEGAQTLPYKPNKKADADMKMIPLAKGGMASRRADGIAQRGKTRGTLIMCGGGYAKGKK